MKRGHFIAFLLGGGCFLLGWLGMPRGLEGSRFSGLSGSASFRPGVAGPVWAVLSVRRPGDGSGGSGLLYAATRRGLYLSADQGVHWKGIFKPGFRGEIRALSMDPADPRFVLAASGSALYASQDGGSRWRRIFRAEVPIRCVAMDPHRLKRILVGTVQGIYLSEDRGLSWVRVNAGFSGRAVRSIVIHPLVPDRYYALADGGLFRSAGDMERWERLRVLRPSEGGAEGDPVETEVLEEPEGLQGLGDLVMDPVSGHLVLGTPAGIFVSRDEGERWSPLPSMGLGTPKVHRLLCSPSGAGSLYAATDAGLFHLPRGAVWSRLQDGLPPGPVQAVGWDPEGRWLLAGTARGLFRIPAPEEPAPFPSSAALFPPALSEEPSVQEVQQAAIRYAEVMPEKIQGWRAGAVWRNWFPKVTLTLDRDKDTTVVSSTSGGKTSFSVGPEDESVSVGVGLTWNLADLVWNPDQTAIDVRSRLMVQLRQDILEEVTRLYFERRRLLGEFQRNPTSDVLLREERSLRMAELSAQLDAITGGWFSRGRRPVPED